MKSLTAIFFASLCLFAHATSVFENQAFIQLKSEPFGNLLTSLVQVNMSQDSGRLNAIEELLDTVAESLSEQTNSNENNISTQRGWCNDQRAALQQEIDTQQGDLDSDNEENNNLSAERVTESAALLHEQDDLATNTNNQEAAQTSLANEEARNDQAVRDYAEAIAACEKSLQLLGTLQANQSSFIQTKAQFTNVVALLQKHLSNKSSPLIEPVISVLTELASQASTSVDQAKLANIVNLINQLLDELRSQEAANVVRHNSTVDSLNTEIASLGDLISQNNDAIVRHTDRIDAIDRRQTELANLIAALEVLLPTLREQLETTNNQCIGYENVYSETKNTLNSQQATLDAVREYFEQHIVPSVQNIDDDVYQDNLTV